MKFTQNKSWKKNKNPWNALLFNSTEHNKKTCLKDQEKIAKEKYFSNILIDYILIFLQSQFPLKNIKKNQI